MIAEIHLQFLCLFVAGSNIGLKFVQLDVPGALHSGESSWLKCLYELGKDELYSVKWYKNNVEFFRYLPSDEPAGQNYELLGVYVDVSYVNILIHIRNKKLTYKKSPYIITIVQFS